MKSLLPALAALMLATGVQAQTSTGQTPKPISMPTAPVPMARPDPDTLRDPAAADAIKAAERKAARLEKEKMRLAGKKARDEEALTAADDRSEKAKAKGSPKAKTAKAEVEDDKTMTRAERRAARRAEQQAAKEAPGEKKAAGEKKMTREERRAARKAAREADEAQALSRDERLAARKKARAEARAARLAEKNAKEEVILPTPARKAKPGVNDGSRP